METVFNGEKGKLVSFLIPQRLAERVRSFAVERLEDTKYVPRKEGPERRQLLLELGVLMLLTSRMDSDVTITGSVIPPEVMGPGDEYTVYTSAEIAMQAQAEMRERWKDCGSATILSEAPRYTPWRNAILTASLGGAFAWGLLSLLGAV